MKKQKTVKENGVTIVNYQPRARMDASDYRDGQAAIEKRQKKGKGFFFSRTAPEPK